MAKTPKNASAPEPSDEDAPPELVKVEVTDQVNLMDGLIIMRPGEVHWLRPDLVDMVPKSKLKD